MPSAVAKHLPEKTNTQAGGIPSKGNNKKLPKTHKTILTQIDPKVRHEKEKEKRYDENALQTEGVQERTPTKK